MPGPAKGCGGRPRKLPEEHELDGTYRKDRHNADAPTPPPTHQKPPNRPAWLPGYARAEWDRIVPLLQAMGVLGKVDRAVLSTYCVAWADYREAVRECNKNGAFLTDGNGKKYANPARKEARELATLLGRLATEFGMSPAARTKIVLAAAKAAGSQKPGTQKPRENSGTETPQQKANRLLGAAC